MEAGYFLDTQDFAHSSCSSGDEEMLRKAKGCAYGFLSLTDATRCSRPGPKLCQSQSRIFEWSRSPATNSRSGLQVSALSKAAIASSWRLSSLSTLPRPAYASARFGLRAAALSYAASASSQRLARAEHYRARARARRNLEKGPAPCQKAKAVVDMTRRKAGIDG